MKKIDLKDTTFCIPVRIESSYRMQNLRSLLKYLDNALNTNFIVLEADNEPHFENNLGIENLIHVYVRDSDIMFHRTKYINQMLHMAKTQYAGVWDTDAIVPINQIEEAATFLRAGENTLVYPFSGAFNVMNELTSAYFHKTLDINCLTAPDIPKQFYYGFYSVGGAYMVDIDKYLKAGGENEYFRCWGPEDAERYARIGILELGVKKVEGVIYHMFHTRGTNSKPPAEAGTNLNNIIEFCKVCGMTTSELLDYIKTWGWNKTVSSKLSPLVSVVMPIYNVEEWIEEAINSILSQSYPNLEFIIVNDGSTDNTVEIVKSFHDDRIIFMDNHENKGNYVRRNEGCKIASGKYICMMDGDDMAFPERIAKQVAIMENDPLLLALGSGLMFSNGGIDIKPRGYNLLKVMLLSNNYVLHPSLIVRTNIFQDVGYYNEEYRFSSDYDLVCKIALRGRIDNTEEVLMKYRQHEKQISSAHHTEQSEIANWIRLKYLEKCGFTLSTEEKSLFTLMILQSEMAKEQVSDYEPLIRKLKQQNIKLGCFDPGILETFLNDFR